MKKRNYKAIIFLILGAIILGVMLAWPRINDPHRTTKKRWKEAGVNCLAGGHTNIALHIHPHLTITVDGEPEIIPANVGIVSNCMSETHTHDETGTLHIESIDAGRTFKLSKLFSVWGKPLQRENHTLKAAVDGEEVSDPENITLEDGQQIVLEYTSNTATTTSEEVSPPLESPLE